MKILKISLLAILSIFIAVYLAFLFILPYSIDLNQYAPQITKSIQDNTDFQVELKGLKVKTAWNLSAGALIEKADLKDSTGKKFAQINGLQVKLSLLPLLFNNIKVDKVNADKILFNLEVDKNGNFSLKKYLTKKLSKNSKKFKFSENMPAIIVKKYRISLIDNQNNYTLKGTDLKVSDFVLNKKIKLKTKGDLVLNGRKQISYKVSIFSKVFPKIDKSGERKDNFIKIFEDLYKYNVRGNVNANLKIGKNTDIDGKINLDGILFTMGEKNLPQSNLNLNFDGDKVKINSNFYTDINSKAIITGFFKNGKHKSIDLKILSDQIDIESTVLIAKTILRTFGIKSLDEISANGFAKADFVIKSDFKKVQSSGYLQIKDANIENKLYNVSLNSVNADVDFSQDAVQIKQAKANLNGQPINITGDVDKNANANILVSAENLSLKGVLLTSGNAKILKENDILSGGVNIRATLDGRLDKAIPKINVVVSNVHLKNKKTKTQIKLTKAVIDTNSLRNRGKAELTNLNVIPTYPAVSSVQKISLPKVNLNFDKKDLNIETTYLYIDNIKTNLSGKISDINSTPRMNSVSISIPEQISVPIAGYAGSNIVINGDLILNGDLNKPEIKGSFTIPLIRLPSASTVVKNTTLRFDKDIIINCPQVQIADSAMSFNAQVDKTFGDKKISIKNVDFLADNINLNTLIPICKNLPKGSNSSMTILNGKGMVKKFKIGRITSGNITSDIAFKNNILYLANLRGDAYFGKIAGDASYDFEHKKTTLDLQGRGLSANPALSGLTGQNNDVNGQLDFDSNISIMGNSKGELLRSLNGDTNFIISNGKMGALGKFEHLLYAQNIVSNSVFKATLNVIAKAITVKNTGVYKYMKGKIAFSHGWATIDWIKTSGPSMSLYITGRCYLPDNTANLTILGRISDDVVNILGPIGELSMDKVISYIPKIGEITAFFASQFTVNPDYENTSMIPYLTPKTELPTKEFKVVIDGEVQKQSSVKSFKWISRPKVIQGAQSEDAQSPSPQTQPPTIPVQNPATIPDFVKKLPDLKN